VPRLATFALAVAVLAGCAAPSALQPSAGDPSTSAAADCPKPTTVLPPLPSHPWPPLDGTPDEVAVRIAAALNETPLRPKGDLAWQTRRGNLTATSHALPDGGTGLDWMFTARNGWPQMDEALVPAFLQHALDTIAGNATERLVFVAQGDDGLILRTLVGSDLRLAAGGWRGEFDESYKPSVLQLAAQRLDDGHARDKAELVQAAAAFVACRMARGHLDWALPLVHVDAPNATALVGVNGRPVLYAAWAWDAGHPPPGCAEYGLYGVQVDAWTGQVVQVQEPQVLPRCPH